MIILQFRVSIQYKKILLVMFMKQYQRFLDQGFRNLVRQAEDGFSLSELIKTGLIMC